MLFFVRIEEITKYMFIVRDSRQTQTVYQSRAKTFYEWQRQELNHRGYVWLKVCLPFIYSVTGVFVGAVGGHYHHRRHHVRCNLAGHGGAPRGPR